MQAYCKPHTEPEDEKEWENKIAAWRWKLTRWEAAGGEYTGVPPPEKPEKEEPEPPPPKEEPGWLTWYLELKRWGTHQLVSGGVMDQPSWAWDMIDLAGKVYESERLRHGTP